jgi:vacuolar-type H+-ATPase subunit H
MITPKHLATFLMGAAAGAAIMKYNSMTPEEQEALLKDLKQKADDVQKEATTAVSQFKDYFEDLQGKGMEALKSNMGQAENMVQDFIAKINSINTTNTDGQTKTS